MSWTTFRISLYTIYVHTARNSFQTLIWNIVAIHEAVSYLCRKNYEWEAIPLSFLIEFVAEAVGEMRTEVS
jgi:uncharacterized membrane protein YjdF